MTLDAFLTRSARRALLALAVGSAAVAPPLSAQTAAPPAVNPAAVANDGYADGVVRRIDAAAAKLTLKHGEIRSLDMPPMTMVFVARDPKQLGGLKVGDAVRFKVEQVGGQLVVTDLQPAR